MSLYSKLENRVIQQVSCDSNHHGFVSRALFIRAHEYKNPPCFLGFALLLFPSLSAFISVLLDRPFHSETKTLVVMVVSSRDTVAPHHRPNRRRERPGSRQRRSIDRKASIHRDSVEGIRDALDPSVRLLSDRARPSPLFLQSFDQTWRRWKARQAEEEARAELEKHRLQLKKEQLRLFGGEVDDDVSLFISEMLDVVLRLFGDIDYTDP